MDFHFALDTEIRFGPGCRREIADASARFGRRVMLVTGGRSFDDAPYGAEIVDSLAGAGLLVVERALTAREPDDAQTRELARRIVEQRVDVVIAIGGGSVMDLGKAAAIVSAGIDLDRALSGAPVETPGVPVVAVPTTAGSGAEVSRAAIVLHRAVGRKRGVRGRGVAPRAAIVDPELVRTTGRVITAEAGLDAMAHALETAVSRAASPLNVLLSGEALSLLLDAIPRSVSAPDDIGARTRAAYAAMLMGINLATASTCLPHRLQYPVGAVTATSHARGVAALLPAWLERTCRFAPGQLAALVRYARLGDDRVNDVALAEGIVARIEGWIQEIGMRTRLRDLGVKRSDIPDLASKVEGKLGNDPGPVERLDLLALYEASL